MRPGAKAATPVAPDRLAAQVLGALRYLPSRLWLQPWLDELRRWNPGLRSGWSTEASPRVELWPQYLVSSKLTRHLGMLPRERGGRLLVKGCLSPDALISCDDWTIALSVQGSEDIPAERLFQDYVLTRALRDDDRFALVHIDTSVTRRLRAGVHFRASRGGERDVRAEDPLSRYIAVRSERVDAIEIDESIVEARLGWLGWHTLHALLSSLELSSLEPPEWRASAARLRDDGIRLLEECGLVAPEYDICGALAASRIDANLLPIYRGEAVDEPAVDVDRSYRPGDAASSAPDAAPAEAAGASAGAIEPPMERMPRRRPPATAADMAATGSEPATRADVEPADVDVALDQPRGSSFDTGGASSDWRPAPAASSVDGSGTESAAMAESAAAPEAREPDLSGPLAPFASLLAELDSLRIDAETIPAFPSPPR